MQEMTYKEREQDIIKEFESYSDWLDKYDYLIEIGKSLPLLEDANKTDDNVINGCQSRVWLNASLEDKKIIFTADAEAVITKGIVNLLIRALNNLSPQEIINADLDFLNKIGLKEHLSPTRANGLLALIKQMKIYAYAYNSLS
jgi:cysteine desulfuration protein SufE